jgi:predicted nuclease of restriction endonuclease-like (RecB) superfamily
MNQDIQEHFQNIREIIREGRAGALKAVNAYALTINWQIGTYLSQQLSEGIYGDYIVDNLAIWLKETEPGLKGYERRSLYRMRSFFTAWQATDWSILPPFLQENEGSEITFPIISTQKIVSTVSTQSQSMGSIPSILLKISWSHHIELLSGCTSEEERLFYLILAVKDKYDVRDLRRQIKSGLFERQMLAKQTLLVPEHPKKELLSEIFRDRYVFEFLNLKEPFSEYDLKKGLLAKMKEFLLELGRDFLFISEEMHLQVGMNDYYVDLVFFHRELQCLVAFDLKIEAFKPEHLGKMNFYLELLDRDVRKSHENPSIGVVLCKTAHEEVVEIAMSRQLSPAMVAAYQTKFVDKNLLRQFLHQWTEDWEQSQQQEES